MRGASTSVPPSVAVSRSRSSRALVRGDLALLARQCSPVPGHGAVAAAVWYGRIATNSTVSTIQVPPPRAFASPSRLRASIAGGQVVQRRLHPIRVSGDTSVPYTTSTSVLIKQSNTYSSFRHQADTHNRSRFSPVPGPRRAGNLSRQPRLSSHLVPARAVACRS